MSSSNHLFLNISNYPDFQIYNGPAFSGSQFKLQSVALFLDYPLLFSFINPILFNNAYF